MGRWWDNDDTDDDNEVDNKCDDRFSFGADFGGNEELMIWLKSRW